MMPGMIILWHGTVDNVPSGWHLCDGTVGTPDLRNRFIVGAGNSYAVGNTGGATTHAHAMFPGTAIAAGADYNHNTDVQSNLPPYYALCYIMKL